MYLIRMKNCAFFARHGVLDEEETLGQRFYVDAALTVEPGRALEDDSIDGTVDYGVAFQVIEKIITGERRFLIEALALEVAKALTAALSADQARRDHRAQAERAGARRARSCRGDRCLARIEQRAYLGLGGNLGDPAKSMGAALQHARRRSADARSWRSPRSTARRPGARPTSPISSTPRPRS